MSQMGIEYKLFLSFGLLFAVWIVRKFVLRQLSKMAVDDESLRLRWVNSAKNAINLLIFIGLISIWLSELQFVALSIATFVVAFVIATREILQCFVGTLYQVGTRSFSVGDWIKAGSFYGEVIRSDWLGTKLLEVDIENGTYSYTGKTIYLPNSLFVTNPIQNLNFMRRYVSHSFTIVREPDNVNVFSIKDEILRKANEYCAAFSVVAERYNGLMARRLDVPLSGPETSVRISTNNLGKNQFMISIFCPTHEALNLEQKLTEDFMSAWYKEAEKFKANKE